MNRKELIARLKEISERMNELANAESLDEAGQTEFDTLVEEQTKRQAQLDRFNAALRATEAAANAELRKSPVPEDGVQIERHVPDQPENRAPKIVMPHRAKPLKGFETDEQAYRAGRWFMARVLGHEPSVQFCRDHGVVTAEDRALATNVNPDGGYLVVPEFESAIIDLREAYGTFRQKARYVPMGADTKSQPRRTSGVTAYFVGENSEITGSDKGWDNVKLVARKMAAMTRYSTEIAEDAIIDIASDLAAEIAYAFAVKEDQCAFIGDGTSTYDGIVGLKAKSDAAAASMHTSAQKVGTSHTMAEFTAMMGKLPEFPGINPEWYCHKQFWGTVMARLGATAGGNMFQTIEGTRPKPLFLGYPVNFVQAMSTSLDQQANLTGLCYFGDLSMAAMFGERRGIRIKTSDQRYFEYDQLAIQGTERIDITIHDIGDANNAGPVIAFKNGA